MFKLTIGRAVIRFYIMMGVIIVAGFTGIWWLSVFALPIFLSAMLGIRFDSPFRKDLPPSELKVLKGGQVQRKAG